MFISTLLITIPTLLLNVHSASAIKFPSPENGDTLLEIQNVANTKHIANDTKDKLNETVCSDFNITLDGEMFINATGVNTFIFDWKNIVKEFDWNQSDCRPNATLLQSIPGQNATTDIVIMDIPFDELNDTLMVTNKNFSECEGGAEFFIQLILPNSVMMESNKTVYQPTFSNYSENSFGICKSTEKDHDMQVKVNATKGINKVLLHCLKSMELREIEKTKGGQFFDRSHRFILENEEKEQLIIPQSDTTMIRLYYFHDVNQTEQTRVSELTREYEMSSLPTCPSKEPSELEPAKSSGSGIFIVLGIVLLLALVILVARVYFVRKIRNRAASVPERPDADLDKDNQLEMKLIN